MSASVLVYNDLLKIDLFRRNTVEDAVSELKDLAFGLNKASLYFVWCVGKFVSSDQLQKKFKTNIAHVAELMETSRATLYRYRTVAQLLTEQEVVRLSGMHVSTNAVIELANQYKVRPDEAKLTLEKLLSGELKTSKLISDDFTQRIIAESKPHKMLPGGDSPEGDSGDTVIANIVNDTEAEADNKTLGEKILESEAEEVLTGEVVDSPARTTSDEDDDYTGDDSMLSTGTKDDTNSQASKDAKACLRQVSSSFAEVCRHLTWISNNLSETIAKAEEHSSVIAYDNELYDTYTEKLNTLYVETVRATLVALKQLPNGVNAGLITEQIPMPKEVRCAFNGRGLFVED